MGILDTTVGNFWVAEYSAQQDAFNTTTLKAAIQTNCRMVLEKQNNDYLIFGIYRTQEGADAACDEMRKIQQVP